MRKEKPVTVSSTFNKLYLYDDLLLDSISKELLLNEYKNFIPGKIDEDFIYRYLLSSNQIRCYGNLNILKSNFMKKDVYGVLAKDTRDAFLFYKIGSLFFKEQGNLYKLVKNTLLYETVNYNYKIFSLNSFGVLQVHNTDLSNKALVKFFNIKYGLDLSKMPLENIQRIYISKNTTNNVLVIFDRKNYNNPHNYYECIIITKNNTFSFPMAMLPKYRFRFSLLRYLLNKSNYPYLYKDTLITKYMRENTNEFISVIEKVLLDQINIEEFLMKLYI